MRENSVTFRSGGLTLEGLFAGGEHDAPAALVCHPHPSYGGSMHNNVVEAILDAMWKRGYATLRFNFRGVGTSEGEYDGGNGEAEDAAAAMAFLRAQPGVRHEASVIAGYSFGAMVALRAGYELAEVSQIVAVALPIGVSEAPALPGSAKSLLLVSGDRDAYSPVAALTALQERIGKAARLEIVKGADHFFGGAEAELSRVIAAALGS